MGIRRKDTQKKRAANIEAAANRAVTDSSVRRIINRDDPTDTSFAQKIAGSSDPVAVARVQARAQAERHNMDEEEIKDIMALNESSNVRPAGHMGRTERPSFNRNPKSGLDSKARRNGWHGRH